MAWFHCSNPEHCWNERFVNNQFINEVYLYFWMVYCSCHQKLFKGTSSDGFIWRFKLNSWTVWHIFLQLCSLIPCSIRPPPLPFFNFVTECLNVERFVTSGYLAWSFLFCATYLYKFKPLVKTCSLLLVNIITLIYLKNNNIPKNWGWGCS